MPFFRERLENLGARFIYSSERRVGRLSLSVGPLGRLSAIGTKMAMSVTSEGTRQIESENAYLSPISDDNVTDIALRCARDSRQREGFGGGDEERISTDEPMHGSRNRAFSFAASASTNGSSRE